MAATYNHSAEEVERLGSRGEDVVFRLRRFCAVQHKAALGLPWCDATARGGMVLAGSGGSGISD